MEDVLTGIACSVVMDETLADVQSRIAAYYTETITRFGATPRGVDWTCRATQEMRFVQLLKLCDIPAPFSLNDFGCGYGALAAFLGSRDPAARVDYVGIDLSEVMIRRARRRYRGMPGRRFVVGDTALRRADYSVASGVMNVQLDIARNIWEAFVAETLRTMRRCSRLGFAVNFLEESPSAPASHALYRTAPEPWVQFCHDTLGCSAEIIRGYGMREFTLLFRPDREWSHDGSFAVRPARQTTASGRAPAKQRDKKHAAADVPDPHALALQAAAASLLSPEDHADETRIHDAFRLLRREAPVYWVALPRVKPFWAVTRYHDVVEVYRRGAGFIAGPRTILASEVAEMSMRQLSGRERLLRPLTQMDDPDHSLYRAIAQPWFLPPALAGFTQRIADLARTTVDDISANGGQCDFGQVAVQFPLRIIANIMGIPEVDEPALDRLLRILVGANDPRRQSGEQSANAVPEALRGCRDYFDALAAERRSCPRADLASVIANAAVGGAPLPQFERVSYYILLTVAGYDTTAFALSGGLQALIKHPDQLARLQRDPSLLDSAIEEILRWTTPGRHVMRTATKDSVLGGQPIRAGEAVAIFLPSANRDEAVFAEADCFRIDRAPNPHLTFGRGVHFCLGHVLARMELRALFGELLRRLHSVEIAGPTRRAESVLLTGFTSLPVRFGLR
jgi:cytochrome P450